jgi:histidinol-phosphate aminotransferase
VGNGADELIGLIALAAFEPGDEVVVPHPSFEPYTTCVALAGAVPVASPLVKYETDLEDMRRRVSARTKAVIICSPHNPAATIVRTKSLLAFLDALGADPPLVVLDEAYGDFCDDPEYPDGIALLRRHTRLILLRTFSKIAGLAGLRVGYASAKEAIGTSTASARTTSRLGQAGRAGRHRAPAANRRGDRGGVPGAALARAPTPVAGELPARPAPDACGVHKRLHRGT